MTNRTVVIVVIVIVILIVVWLLSSSGTRVTEVTLENFNNLNNPISADPEAPLQLAPYYSGGSLQGLEQNLLDRLPCSPSCCGLSWEVPFDGLNEEQIKAALIQNAQAIDGGGRFVKNSYSCGVGSADVGCPCVTPENANFIANRGGNTNGINMVDPSFLIPGPSGDLEQDTNISINGGGYVDPRDMSHLNPRSNNKNQNMDNVQSYDAPLTREQLQNYVF